MRTLEQHEIRAVAGGEGTCTPDDAGGNNLGGVTDPPGLGDDLVNIYEGIVQATSHVIERVADSFQD